MILVKATTTVDLFWGGDSSQVLFHRPFTDSASNVVPQYLVNWFNGDPTLIWTYFM